MWLHNFRGGGSVALAAKKPALNKNTLTITAGKKATLKVKNKIKGSTYKWSSSKTKVATVTKAGVVKGIKAGKSTIKCKVTTKATKKVKAKTYTLKCKVTVKKKTIINETASPDIVPTTEPTNEPSLAPTNEPTNEPSLAPSNEPTVEPTTEPTIEPTVAPTANPEELTVSTQEGLESALKAKETRSLTLETTAAETFTIPEGEYNDIALVIDAPNADIENSGVFKEITIKAIKNSTWTEKAQGNIFMVMAVAAHINVIKEAIIEKIIFLKTETQANAVLTINEGGIVENVSVQSNVKLAIDGNSETSVPVAVENTAGNTEITSAIPLAIETAINVKITLDKGAENSTVKTTTDVSVEIQNNTAASVNVTKSTGTTQTVSSGTGTTVSNTNSSYRPAKPSTPTPTPVPTEAPTPEEDKTIILYENEEGSEEAVTITAEELSTLLGDTDSIKGYTIHIDTTPNNDYNGLGFIKAYILKDWSNIVTGTAGWGDDNVADNVLAEGNEYVLSGNLLTLLLANGFEIYPVDCKITKVTIKPNSTVPEEPPTPDEPDQPTEPDIGYLNIEADWAQDYNSAKAINEDTFSAYTAEWLIGKKITVTYTIDEAGYTNLGIYAGANEYAGEGNFIEIKKKEGTGGSEYSFDITEEIAGKLINGGLYVASDHATIDSIVIAPSSGT